MDRDAANSNLASDAAEAEQMISCWGTRSPIASPWDRSKIAGIYPANAACFSPENKFTDSLGEVAGFNLHAGATAKAHERKKLEWLCRYISRSVLSKKRLSLTAQGKEHYRDGTTHVIFNPLNFIAGLAALVPKPRINLIRF